MFVLKLHEHYHDPSFRAYKSYFFFDNEIICLGSNIQNSDADHTTETTLFQNWMPDEKMPIQINGEIITEFPYEFHGVKGEKLTIMDSYNNGYIIPDSGSVKLIRNTQQSRDAWNKGDTEGAFSTCWLNHGYAPKDDGYGSVRYEYVMLVQTDAASLSKYANALPYRVLLQNHQAHILEHLTQHTIAYALFETDWVIPYGIVRKTDTPIMIMVKENADNVVLSLADPDLRLPKRRNLGYLDDEANATPARPSIVRVELRGNWVIPDNSENVVIKEIRNSVTVLEFTCAYGMTSEIILHKGE
jgi:chondroitin-sulfate-ABC endolyase/exolyase